MTKVIVSFASRTLIAGMLVVVATGGCFAQESKGGGGRLAGTWDATVRIKDCVTGNVSETFASIASFNPGGTSIGSTSGRPQSLRTPEHGIWRHVSSNVYEFKFKSFNFNAMGQATGYAIVAHTVELDDTGDTYYSSGTASFFTLNGTPVGGGCSDADGTRMSF
jgi:hypothetical protein